MLQRVSTTSVLAPGRLTGWRGLWSGPNSALLKYLLIVGLLCAAGCIYFVQMNDLTDIHQATLRLERRAEALEQQNIELALQWAHWNTPSYIQQRAEAQKFVPVSTVIQAPIEH
jgi:hypothetical protein